MVRYHDENIRVERRARDLQHTTAVCGHWLRRSGAVYGRRLPTAAVSVQADVPNYQMPPLLPALLLAEEQTAATPYTAES